MGTKTAHSATPWSVRLAPSGDGCFVEAPKENDMPYSLEILGDDYNGYGDAERKRADAEFIVRACNSHDALVDLLRDISGNLKAADPMKERILEALAKVRTN